MDDHYPPGFIENNDDDIEPIEEDLMDDDSDEFGVDDDGFDINKEY